MVIVTKNNCVVIMSYHCSYSFSLPPLNIKFHGEIQLTVYLHCFSFNGTCGKKVHFLQAIGMLPILSISESATIGHFLVSKTLTLKTRPSANLSCVNEFYLHEK